MKNIERIIEKLEQELEKFEEGKISRSCLGYMIGECSIRLSNESYLLKVDEI